MVFLWAPVRDPLNWGRTPTPTTIPPVLCKQRTTSFLLKSYIVTFGKTKILESDTDSGTGLMTRTTRVERTIFYQNSSTLTWSFQYLKFLDIFSMRTVCCLLVIHLLRN